LKVPDRILIIGNNESAIMAANKLLQRASRGDIEILVLGKKRKIEFRESNIFLCTSSLDHNNTWKNIDYLLKPQVKIIQDEPLILNMDEKSVSTKKGTVIKYDYLIIADPFEADISAIKGYDEDARSVETAQNALSLREDLKRISTGDIVIYHDSRSSFTSSYATSLAVSIKNYVSRKDNPDKIKVKLIFGENNSSADKVTEDFIDSTLKKNNIDSVQNFKIKSINVKNRELESESGDSIKYDIPVIFAPYRSREYLEKSKLPRADSGFVEVNIKTLAVKGHDDIFMLGYIGSEFKNNWKTLYNQVDYVSGRIASLASSYPDSGNYEYQYNDIVITGNERASSLSYDGNSLEIGAESRTDFLIKVYGYQTFFGIYAMGFI
jgi:sulfide:quinone oxidoreductase